MPDSSGATVFDDLPEWLVVDEILVRLPPKDVLRCRAIRKSWRSGTSTDKFIVAHHAHQPSLPIIEHRKGICRLVVLGGAGGGASSGRKIQPVLQYGPRSRSEGPGLRADVMRHAACDGLLILAQQPDFYICNPATRRCASLPHPPLGPGICSVAVVAFYRHHPSGEHRVLWVAYSDYSISAIYPPDYFVLTAGSDDQPRRIQWPAVSSQGFPATRSPSDLPPVHHRGSLHWAMGLGITAFDTVAETFRQMSRPRPAQQGDKVSLFEMAGTLAWCRTARDRVTLDVWVMQDYDAETWGFQYRIKLSAMEASPPLNFMVKCVPRMAMINERELLIEQRPDRLLHCDIDGTFLGNVESRENENILTLTKHRLQESLISIPLFERQAEDGVDKELPFVIVL